MTHTHRPSLFARRNPWLPLAVAGFMAACSQTPQAAVSPAETAVQVREQGCGASGQPAALRPVQEGLKAQGMALKARCDAQTGAWVVQVIVVDGMRASQVVRGPLADGAEVDMGTPSGVVAVGAPQDFSPDVHHNRSWLRTVMARHHFDNLPDAWWHYAQRGAVPAQAGDTDLAAR